MEDDYFNQMFGEVDMDMDDTVKNEDCSNFFTTRKVIISSLLMQSYPARALDRRLQVDWARDPREDPRVLMSLRVDFEPMG